MKFTVFGIILLPAILNTLSESRIVNIDCQFGWDTFGTLGNISCCNMNQNLNILEENVTLNISNKDENKYTLGFSVKNNFVYYLPKGIGKSFKYLEALEFIYTGLKAITSKDLKEFRNLKFLNLANNRIESLESDLFRYNFRIHTVNLNANQISLIEPIFIKTKNDLTILKLESNLCYSGSANDKSELDNVIETIKIKCSEFAQIIESRLETNHRMIEHASEEHKKLNHSVELLTYKCDRLTKIEMDLNNLNQSFTTIQYDFTGFKGASESKVDNFCNKMQSEIKYLKPLPNLVSNLNIELKQVINTFSSRMNSIETKNSMNLNKTMATEKSLKSTNDNVAIIESNLKQFQSNLTSIEERFGNINVLITNAINEFKRTGNDTNKQIVQLSNSIKNVNSTISKELLRVNSDMVSGRKILTQNIENQVKNLKMQMKNNLSDTELRLTTKIKLLLNHTNNINNERLKDIDVLAKSYNFTIKTLFTKMDDLSKNSTQNQIQTKKITNNLDQKVENQSLQLETLNSFLSRNIYPMIQKHEEEMSNYVKILIASNIILVVLLVIAVLSLIYILKFKTSSNNYQKIKREKNSNGQQFNTISTNFPIYDQYNEPVYATTNINDEPIYESYGNHSVYDSDDPQHYEHSDNLKYNQDVNNIYESTQDLTQNVLDDPYSYNNDTLYDTTCDDQCRKADESRNDVKNCEINESEDDAIYEATGHLKALKDELKTSFDVPEEHLYAVIPAMVTEEKMEDESKIYAVVRKNRD